MPRLNFDDVCNPTYHLSMMNIKFWQLGLVATTLGSTVWISGCVDPLQRDTEQELREQLIASNRIYLQAIAAGPVIELNRQPSDVATELTQERRTQLDNMSGPTAYDNDPLQLGPNLIGQEEQDTVRITLQRAIHLAAKNNLDVKIAQIQPAISQAQITAAEANFDAVFFSNFDFQKLDTPQPQSGAGLENFGTVNQDTKTLTTGIRKNLTSGGQMSFSTEFARNHRNRFHSTNHGLTTPQRLVPDSGDVGALF